MLRLDSDVQYVKGVGPRRASLLNSRGIRTVQDLLLHIPKAYQDRANFVPLSSLRIGQDVAIHARVYRSRAIQTRTRGRIFDVILTDGSSFAHANWFSSAAWISIGTNRSSSSSIRSLNCLTTAMNRHRWTSGAWYRSMKKSA